MMGSSTETYNKREVPETKKQSPNTGARANHTLHAQTKLYTSNYRSHTRTHDKNNTTNDHSWIERSGPAAARQTLARPGPRQTSTLPLMLTSARPPTRAWEMARTVVAPPLSVVKCLWEVFVWESCRARVCAGVRGVVSVGVSCVRVTC